MHVLGDMSIPEDPGGELMSKSFLKFVAVAFLATPPLLMPVPADAQKAQKVQRSCSDVCDEYCRTSTYRSYCIQNCPQRCELRRMQKKK
jgi:hypothetical protein